jgi:hypothetical protein
MKPFLLLLATALLAAPAPDLSEVKAIYVLPMSNSLDQFLAIRLTKGGTLQVVTDPKKADAVFTDRLGVDVQEKLDELFGEKRKNPDADNDKMTGSSHQTMQPLPHGRGGVFLIDRKTRNIIWGMYARPKNTTPDEMNRLAELIVDKFEKERKGK